MKRLLIIALLIFIFLNSKAQGWQDTTRMIDHFFDRYQPNNPGCQLSISRNGKLVYSRAWGLADLERHAPYTAETITEAGSITKQFTAAAVLLLEQQGKLSLNDDVRKYVPELPNYGTVIRLRHLLHHTSGIREWSDLEAITGWPRTTKAYTNEDVLDMLYHQKGLNNKPGAEYIYSNSNYLLLTLIIERVSGMRLPDFTKKYIFEPAGMTHSSWRDDFKRVVPNRGIAYIKKNGRYEINMPNENVYGPGALLTTTEDLLKWTNFILSNKLGTPGLLAKQLALDPLPNGEAIYAAGLFIGKYRGYDIISHTGQTAGYVGVVESLPALNLSAAWLSNTTESSDSLYVGINKIDNLFIKDAPAITTEKSAKAPVGSILQAKKHVGWYRDARNNQGIQMTLKHDTLLLDKTPLIPINETTFKYLESTIKFYPAGGFMLNTADKRKLAFTKEPEAKTTFHDLRTIAGKYYSAETESGFTIMLEEDKLTLVKNYLKDVSLIPTYKNAFNFSLNVDSDMTPVEANILFKRNSKGNVTGCQVSMNDARGIKFVKVN